MLYTNNITHYTQTKTFKTKQKVNIKIVQGVIIFVENPLYKFYIKNSYKIELRIYF